MEIYKTFTNGNGRTLVPNDTPANYNNDRMILVQEEPRGPSMLIEIPKTAALGATGKLVLPDVPQLRNQDEQTIIIKALRLIPDTVLATAPTLGGANAPLTELIKMSLTLYSEGWEKGQLIPALSLVDTFTEGSGIPYRDRTTKLANWRSVVWNKSYFTYANGTPSIAGAYNVILEVEYVRLNSDGLEIIGPA